MEHSEALKKYLECEKIKTIKINDEDYPKKLKQI